MYLPRVRVKLNGARRAAGGMYTVSRSRVRHHAACIEIDFVIFDHVIDVNARVDHFFLGWFLSTMSRKSEISSRTCDLISSTLSRDEKTPPPDFLCLRASAGADAHETRRGAGLRRRCTWQQRRRGALPLRR